MPPRPFAPQFVAGFLASFLAACTCSSPSVEDGRFHCATTADCLTGFACVVGECKRADGGSGGGGTGGGGGGTDGGTGGGGGVCGGCRDSQGTCQPGTAKTNCGSPGATCQSCGGPQLCVSGACVDPPGDTCANVEPLPAASFNTTLTGYTNGGNGTCGTGTGVDRIYSFDVPLLATVTVAVTAVGGGQQTIVYLHQGTCAGTSVGCARATAPGAAVTMTANNVPPGTYFLWLDAATPSTGSFDVTVTQVSVNGGPGDNCALGATSLTFAGTTAAAAGTTTGFLDDTASNLCAAGTGAPDRVYSFTLPAPARVSARVASTAFSPVVSIRGPSPTCTVTNEVLCAGPAAGSATATGNLGAGNYSLWVDAMSGSGPYSLTVRAIPSADGGSCAAPETLPFNAGVAASAGTTSGPSALSGTCGGNGSEQVYQFTQPFAGAFNASVSAGPGLVPVLYLRGACNTAADVACSDAGTDGGVASLDLPVLDAGVYFLVVDGDQNSAGPFTLNAAQAVAASGSGDSCATPRVITLLGSAASYTGNTSTLGNDNNPSCDKSNSTGGRDAVFELVAPRTGLLTVSTIASWDANLSVRTGPACASAPEATDGGPPCVDVGGGNELLTIQASYGTTYWIWVSGHTQNDFGAFTLNVSLP